MTVILNFYFNELFVKKKTKKKQVCPHYDKSDTSKFRK